MSAYQLRIHTHGPGVPATIRVAIVDRPTMFTQSLEIALSRETDLEWIWTAHDTAESFRQWREAPPHVLLVDVDAADGIWQFLQQVRRSDTPTQIVILTNNQSGTYLDQAIALGFSGYVLKSEPLEMVLRAVRRTVRGETAFSEEVARKLEFDAKQNRHVYLGRSLSQHLTPRQVEILRLLATGATAKEIARSLKLSVKGVNSHTYRIMERLGIHSRVRLARLAIREGLISP